MKNVGLLLLTVGVAVSAMYGARLAPDMRAQMVSQGRASLLAGRREQAHQAYCETFGEGERPPLATLDGCPEPSAEGEDGPSGVNVEAECAGRDAPEQSEEEIAAAGHGSLEPHYLRDPSVLSADQQRLRTEWLARAEDAIDPGAAAAVLRPIAPPDRLSGWFGDSGIMFLLGLVLVIAGAVLGRVAARREAAAEPEAKDGDAPARDLGELLAELQEAVAELAAQTEGVEDPKPEGFDKLKDAVHELQLERFEPVVTSAPKVQAKYGMGPFAEIFGPLSAAERHVNRAWSALVDRHWPEASSSLARAAEDLEDAKAALDRAVKEGA